LDDILAIFLLLLGLGLGLAFSIYLTKIRKESIEKEAQASTAVEKATLLESIRNRDAQIAALSSDTEGLRNDLRMEQQSLKDEIQRRSAAEERNNKIIGLEKALVAKEEEMRDIQVESENRFGHISELENEKKVFEEKIVFLNEGREKLMESFKALSADALANNNQAFLHLAGETLEKHQMIAKGDLELRQKSIDEMVKPIRESLDTVNVEMRKLELARLESYTKLTEQVSSLGVAQSKLQLETGNLVKALRNPTVRGRWGEITLHRVVELSGMSCHCDFSEQQTYAAEGGNLRPDMVINLPEGRSIVVDSKTPMNAYLEALEAPEEDERIKKLNSHASAIRSHINQLSTKAYWQQLDRTPEFVVLFIPGEVFFSAALERDPELIEFGMQNRVVLATPITLISLLKVVAQGWTQQAVEANAQRLNDLAKELYDRVSIFTDNLAKMGKTLGKTVEAYNSAVGSFEQRILVTTRKLKEVNAAIGDEIPSLEIVEKKARELRSPEVE
jgi:DNA recombination protein RmuC